MADGDIDYDAIGKEVERVYATPRRALGSPHAGDTVGYPVSGRVTSVPGAPRDGGKRKHQGYDIATPVGTPIPYDNEGEVIETGENGKAGRFVRVRGNDGAEDFYAHLSESNVQQGQRITRGTILGKSGGAKGAPGSGNSTGPHLHYSHTEGGSAPSKPAAKASAPVDYDKIAAGMSDAPVDYDAAAAEVDAGAVTPSVSSSKPQPTGVAAPPPPPDPLGAEAPRAAVSSGPSGAPARGPASAVQQPARRVVRRQASPRLSAENRQALESARLLYDIFSGNREQRKNAEVAGRVLRQTGIVPGTSPFAFDKTQAPATPQAAQARGIAERTVHKQELAKRLAGGDESAMVEAGAAAPPIPESSMSAQPGRLARISNAITAAGRANADKGLARRVYDAVNPLSVVSDLAPVAGEVVRQGVGGVEDATGLNLRDVAPGLYSREAVGAQNIGSGVVSGATLGQIDLGRTEYGERNPLVQGIVPIGEREEAANTQYGAGQFVGGLVPAIAGGALAEAVAPTAEGAGLLMRAGMHGARDAATGLAIGAGQRPGQDESVLDVGKRAGRSALAFGAQGVLSPVLSKIGGEYVGAALGQAAGGQIGRELEGRETTAGDVAFDLATGAGFKAGGDLVGARGEVDPEAQRQANVDRIARQNLAPTAIRPDQRFEPGQVIATTSPTTGFESRAKVLETLPDGSVRIETASGKTGVLSLGHIAAYNVRPVEAPPAKPLVPLPGELPEPVAARPVAPDAPLPSFAEGQRVALDHGAEGTVRAVSKNGGIVIEGDAGDTRALSPDMIRGLGVRVTAEAPPAEPVAPAPIAPAGEPIEPATPPATTPAPPEEPVSASQPSGGIPSQRTFAPGDMVDVTHPETGRVARARVVETVPDGVVVENRAGIRNTLSPDVAHALDLRPTSDGPTPPAPRGLPVEPSREPTAVEPPKSEAAPVADQLADLGYTGPEHREVERDYTPEQFAALSDEEKHAAYQKAIVERDTDPLTQLGNKRALGRAIDEHRARTGEEPVVTAIDANALSAFNDALGGHPAGDAFLHATALALKEEGLTAYRGAGGDEFYIVGDDHDTQHAAIERALDRLRATEIGFKAKDGSDIIVTNSTFSHGTDRGKVAADAELYRDKARREGTDRPVADSPKGTVPPDLDVRVRESGEPWRGRPDAAGDNPNARQERADAGAHAPAPTGAGEVAPAAPGSEPVERPRIVHRDFGDVEDLGPAVGGGRAIRDKDGVVHVIQDHESVGNQRVQTPEAEPAPPADAEKPKGPPRAGFDEDGTFHPDAFWNPDTSGLSGKYADAFNELLRQKAERGEITPKTVETHESIKAAAAEIAPELAKHVAEYKPGETAPSREVVLAARQYSEDLVASATELNAQADVGVDAEGRPLGDLEVAALRAQATEQLGAASDLIGGVLNIASEAGRNLGALGIQTRALAERGDVSPERAAAMVRARARARNADVDSAKVKKSVTEAVAQAGKGQAATKRVLDLVRALRDGGIDTEKLSKPTGEGLSEKDVVAEIKRQRTAKPKDADASVESAPKKATLSDRLAQKEAEARARIAEKKRNLATGSQASANAVVDLLADYVVVGAAKLARAGIDLATWTKEMISEFGEEVRPHLDDIRKGSLGMLTEERRAMQRDRDVSAVTEGKPENFTGDEVERLINERRAKRAADRARVRELTDTGPSEVKVSKQEQTTYPREVDEQTKASQVDDAWKAYEREDADYNAALGQKAEAARATDRAKADVDVAATAVTHRRAELLDARGEEVAEARQALKDAKEEQSSADEAFDRAKREQRRADVKAEKQAQRARREAKAKALREERATQRQSDRYDASLRGKLETDAKTATGKTPDDMGRVGAAKLADPTMSKERWSREMTAQYGDAFTKNRQPIVDDAARRYLDARDAHSAASNERNAQIAGAGGKEPASYLTDEQLVALGRDLVKAREAQTATRRDLFKTFRRVDEQGFFEKAEAWRKSLGFLGNIVGPAKDFLGTGAYVHGSENLSRFVGSIADQMLSPFTGRRTAAHTIGAIPAATRAGIVDGTKHAIEYWKNGAPSDRLEALDIHREVFTEDPNALQSVRDWLINHGFRLREAADAPNYESALVYGRHQAAKVQALNERRAGTLGEKSVPARRRELLADPAWNDSTMTNLSHQISVREWVKNFADVETFKNDNRASGIIRDIRRKLGPFGNFVMSLAIPFEKASTNVKIEKWRHTPVVGAVPETLRSGRKIVVGTRAGLEGPRARDVAAGIGKEVLGRELTPEQATAVESFRKGLDTVFTAEDQYRLQRMVGQQFTGSLLALAGTAAAMKGIALGYQWYDQGENDTNEAAGRTPLSVYNPATKSWDDLSWLEPALGPFFAAVTMYQNVKRRGEKGKSGAQAIGEAVGATLTRDAVDLPAARSASDTTNLIDQALRGSSITDVAANYAGRVAGSFIPAGVADVAKLADTRDARIDPKGFVEQVEARTPGLRNRVPTRKTALGDEIPESDLNTILPTRGQPDRSGDPVIGEALRVGADLTKYKKKAGETRDDAREAIVEKGTAARAQLERLVQSDAYKRLGTLTNGTALQRSLFEATEKRAHATKDHLETDAGRDKFDYRTRVESRRLDLVEQLRGDEWFSSQTPEKQKEIEKHFNQGYRSAFGLKSVVGASPAEQAAKERTTRRHFDRFGESVDPSKVIERLKNPKAKWVWVPPAAKQEGP